MLSDGIQAKALGVGNANWDFEVICFQGIFMSEAGLGKFLMLFFFCVYPKERG